MSINLLPWRETLRQTRRRRDTLYLTGALLLVIFAIVVWQWRQQALLITQGRQLMALNIRLQQIATKYNAALKIQTAQNKAFQLAETFKKQHHLNQKMVDILASFVANMPANAYLKQIELKDSQLIFKGEMTSHRELITFLRDLEQRMQLRTAAVETTKAAGDQGASEFMIAYRLTL